MYSNVYPGVYPPYPGGPGQTGNQPQQPASAPVGSTQPGYVCRPVTSREEAVASQVDFLGPGSVMPDFGHGMIYFKRFNPNSGAAEFYEFTLRQPQPPAQQSAAPVAYDPRGDIDTLRGEVEALRGELEDIKKAGPKRTGGKAAE